MKEEDKPRVADERMELFFKRLLGLKGDIKEAAENSKDKTLHHIYEKLNQIIKEGK